MNRSFRTTRWAYLGLSRLEDRTAPAGVVSLASSANPGQLSDGGGGPSYVELDPLEGTNSVTNRQVSADGRYTVFASAAVNLFAGQVDMNNTYDVFLYDRVIGATLLVSRQSGATATTGNGESGSAAISADGRYVAFASEATDLVAGMTVSAGGVSNMFLFNRMTGLCTLVSHDVAAPLGGASYDARMPLFSADGNVVVFSSQSVNLVAGFPNPGGSAAAPHSHAYAFDTSTGQVTLIDHAFGSASVPGNSSASPSTLSADGRYVTFGSNASNLLDATSASKGDVYRHDRQSGVNLLISRSGYTVPYGGNGPSGIPVISDDGRWISFTSAAKNLVPGATTSGYQIFLADADAGVVSLVSHTPANPLSGSNGESVIAAISGDGRFLAYTSLATDLVNGFVDGNGFNYDVYHYDRLVDQSTLISHQAGSATVSGNGGTPKNPAISANGRYVVFVSLASDLVPGFVDNNGSGIYVDSDPGHDLYRFDIMTGATELVSGRYGSTTLSGNRGSVYAEASADGQTVAWTTTASDITPGVLDNNGLDDVYVRDLSAGTSALATRRLGAPSLSAGGASQWTQLSADGRYLVFTSKATNIVAAQVDTEQSEDVFLLDRQTKTTVLVSHAVGTSAVAANSGSGIPVMSADGRYVAYSSFATDLVGGFTDGNGPQVFGPGGTDVYLFDRITGTNTLVSRQAGAANAGGNSTSGSVTLYVNDLLAISDDGRYVAYFSLATDLVAGFVDNNGTIVGNNMGADVFVFDRVTGMNELVSHAPGAAQEGGNGSSFGPTFSGDGRYVAYWSSATNLVTGMTGVGGRDVFLYDRQTGVTALVSHAAGSATAAGNGGSNESKLSKDGNYVVYQSASNNLIAGGSDTNNLNDVFLYDRQSGVNVLVSHTYGSATDAGTLESNLNPGGYGTNGRAVSDDGRFVTYESGAGDLVNGFVDGNGQPTFGGGSYPGDVYLYDRLTGANTLLTHTAASATISANGPSYQATVSGDGRFVAFTSRADNLSTGSPAGGLINVYVHDRLLGTTKLVSRSVTGSMPEGLRQSGQPVVNQDGSLVVFWSDADNLVQGDFNAFRDVFAYVTPPPRVQSIQVDSGSAQRSVVRSLTVTFDQPVLFTGSPAAAFALGGVAVAVSSPDNVTFTLTFSGPGTQFGSLADGNYQLTVLAAQVFNVGPLDGNGDGVGGDDYTFNFHRLFGDADGDRDVDAVDYGAFRGAFGGTANLAFDFDNDGDVDAVDFGQFRGRFGTSI